MPEKKKAFSNEEQVQRIWDKEKVVQTMNRHTYMYANEMRREEINELWVAERENRSTASLGYNNGYYVGMDNVISHYVVARSEELYRQSEARKRVFPQAVSGDRDIPTGMATMRTATTPLVYIADDGRTARYLALDIGQKTIILPDGSVKAYHVFGRVFADLIREDDSWKIWHLVLQNDHSAAAGEKYTDVPVLQDSEEDPLAAEFGEPPVTEDVYTPLYGWEYMYDEMPRPYTTYRQEDSYTAGGTLGKPYYKRVRLEE